MVQRLGRRLGPEFDDNWRTMDDHSLVDSGWAVEPTRNSMTTVFRKIIDWAADCDPNSEINNRHSRAWAADLLTKKNDCETAVRS